MTCWEVFSGGRTPYPAINPKELPKLLEEGTRLEYPSNAANATEMYIDHNMLTIVQGLTLPVQLLSDVQMLEVLA